MTIISYLISINFVIYWIIDKLNMISVRKPDIFLTENDIPLKLR